MNNLPYAQKGFRYNVYRFYLEDLFDSYVQRLSVRGGFTCPNRDGSKGTSGCIYCNNESFLPFYYDKEKSIAEQVAHGSAYLDDRFGKGKYIVYFQSYTNSYAPVKELEKKYKEALNHPSVVGLAVSTRPDCVDRSLCELLSDIAQDYYVNLEIGIESVYDRSLQWMKRGHTHKETLDTLQLLSGYSIPTTAHLILGLPTETEEQMLDMMSQVNSYPIQFLKFHHLQIIKNTELEKVYARDPFKVFGFQEYAEFMAKIISRTDEKFIFQRLASQTSEEYLIAPKWNKKTTAFLMLLQKKMREMDLWQGKNKI